jgi:hypothetical protein
MQVLLCASVLCILYLRNLPKPSLINSQMYVFQHWTHYQPDHLNSFRTLKLLDAPDYSYRSLN